MASAVVFQLNSDNNIETFLSYYISSAKPHNYISQILVRQMLYFSGLHEVKHEYPC